MEQNVTLLTDALAALEENFLVVVTGAGISLASGIDTFRGSDPGAVWKRNITEMATYHFFRQDPVESWRWYLSRFDKLRVARPNPAHRALVDLERWQLGRGGRFVLVTQNIDTLHEMAGSREMVKVHGSSDRVRCPATGCRHGAPTGSLPRPDAELEAFLAAPSHDALPRCPECGDVLRPHVLWFDEHYGEHRDYQWARVQEAAHNMSLALFVGTSFSVGVTDLFLQAGIGSGTPVITIDPAGGPLPYPGLGPPAVTVLEEKAEELLPAVCERLGTG